MAIHRAATDQLHSSQALSDQEQLQLRCHEAGLPGHITACVPVPAPASTFTLVFDALNTSIEEGFVDETDAAALDPSLFFILPRMALLSGVLQAVRPPCMEARKVPLQVFAPRLCQDLNPAVMLAIHHLDAREQHTLRRVLAGQDAGSSDPRLLSIYRAVCMTADKVSHSQGAQWVSLVQRGALVCSESRKGLLKMLLQLFASVKLASNVHRITLSIDSYTRGTLPRGPPKH